MKVVGYTYDADIHCPDCSEKVFGLKLTHPELVGDPIDSEGNEVHPIFSIDEAGDTPDHCGDCGAFIDNSWSGETVKYAITALREYVYDTMMDEATKGNPETLDTWVENLEWCATDKTDDLTIHLYKEVREREEEAEVA